MCEYCSIVENVNGAGRKFFKSARDIFGTGQGLAGLALDTDGVWTIHYEDCDDTGIMFDVTVDYCLKCGRHLTPEEPLTLEELKEMDGEPVWCKETECWGIINIDEFGAWANIPFFGSFRPNNFNYDIQSRSLTLYRHKPIEEEKQQ